MNRLKRVLASALALGLGMALIACDNPAQRKSASPVFLTATAETALLEVDVFNAPLEGDDVTFTVESHPKNDNEDFPPDAPPGFADVVVNTMRVTFNRVDGGHTDPPGWTQSVAFEVEVEADVSIDFPLIPVILKTQAPLVYLWNGGLDPETGQAFIICRATVEFWGQTNSGHDVYTSASLLLHFADYSN